MEQSKPTPVMELIDLMYRPYSPLELYLHENHSLPVVHRNGDRWYYRFFIYHSSYRDNCVYLRPNKMLSVNMDDFSDFKIERIPVSEYKVDLSSRSGQSDQLSYDEMLFYFEVIKNRYVKGRFVDRGMVSFYAGLFKDYVGEAVLPCYYSLSPEFMSWLFNERRG